MIVMRETDTVMLSPKSEIFLERSLRFPFGEECRGGLVRSS